MSFSDRRAALNMSNNIDIFLRPDAGIESRRLLSNSVQELRLLPAVDKNGVELPFRIGPGVDQFNDHCYPVRLARFAGVTRKATFIVTPKNGQLVHGQDPYTYFYWKIRRSENIPQEWKAWTQGRPGSGAPLSKPQECMLVQALLTQYGGNVFVDAQNRYAPKGPYIVVFNQTAMDDFLEKANTLKSGCSTDSSDPNDYELGDVFSCENGKLLRVYMKQGRGGFNSYVVDVTQIVFPLSIDYVRSVWRNWDDILNFMTVEEQFQLLAELFGAAAVDFAFIGSVYYDYVPGSIKGAYSQYINNMTIFGASAIPNQQSVATRYEQQVTGQPVAPVVGQVNNVQVPPSQVGNAPTYPPTPPAMSQRNMPVQHETAASQSANVQPITPDRTPVANPVVPVAESQAPATVTSPTVPVSHVSQPPMPPSPNVAPMDAAVAKQPVMPDSTDTEKVPFAKPPTVLPVASPITSATLPSGSDNTADFASRIEEQKKLIDQQLQNG